MSADQTFDLKGQRIWVAGNRGMVGSALVRRLASEDCEVLTADRASLDLRRQDDTERWIADRRPDGIILAAGKVGGIAANDSLPAEFLYDNITICSNVIAAAHRRHTRKLLFLGSSCIYPRLAPQPITEEALLTGPLEPTNQWYAIAKIAGIKMVEAYRTQYGCDFISAMPTNLYGPGDNFHPTSSHVLPAFIRRFHEAKARGDGNVEIWGTGSPRREFLHVDDCADALIFLVRHYSDLQPVNIGSGEDLTILDLARKIAVAVGFTGTISTDPSKPDGMPRRLMSSDRLQALGWSPRIALDDGIRTTYQWYLANESQARR